MSSFPKRPKRRRGVILSSEGWQHLQSAQAQSEIAANGGNPYTLEDLNELTGLSAHTLTKIRRRNIAVDKRSLEDYFRTFNLTLTPKDYAQPAAATAVPSQPVRPLQQDWGEAIDVSHFYGRTQELAALETWIQVDRCRLVGVLGMGGIGKTALVAKIAQQLQSQFEYVIWRSLRNAPPLETLLGEIIAFLSEGQDTQPEIKRLLHCLQTSRSLVILDNVETILLPGECAGQYRLGYENYGELFRLIGEIAHTSCLIFTSREKPAEMAALEGFTLPTHTLQLHGSLEAAQVLLQAKGLSGSEEKRQELCDRYGSNPLALKIVATSIQDLFEGDIEVFLAQEIAVFNSIEKLLDQQFMRLCPSEKAIMYWLAINRDQVSISELMDDIIPAVSKTRLLEDLESLSWRSLIERAPPIHTEHPLVRYTQQPVVMEYIIHRLVENVCSEILSLPRGDKVGMLTLQPTSLFIRYALLKTTVKDYIRHSQERLILQPIAEHFRRTFSTIASLEKQVQSILAALRQADAPLIGYGVGNLINLCNYLQVDLSGYDFSRLKILHAYLQNTTFKRVDFQNADFSKTTFTKTIESVLAVAFSPDDSLLATGDSKGMVHVWRVDTDQQLLTLKGHTNWIWSVAFSPNGELLASGSEDQTIQLWNVATGQPVRTLIGHTDWIWAVAFSPDGRLLASGSDDQTVRLWDVNTGQLIKTLQGHTDRVWSIALHPDSHLLASSGVDQTVRLWDLSTGQLLKTLKGHTATVTSVDFSLDGQLLASGSRDRTVRLWDVKTGEQVQRLKGHDGWVWSVAFRPTPANAPKFLQTSPLMSTQYTLASCSEDQTVRLWDIKTGQTLRILQGHRKPVAAIDFDAAGQRLASGGHDQAVRLWDVNTGHVLKTLHGYTNGIQAIACIPKLDQARGANGSEQTRQQRGNGSPSDGLPSDSLPSVSSFLASAGHDPVIRLWDLKTGHVLKTLHKHTNWVRALAVSPNGRILASGGHDRMVYVWDLSTGKVLKSLFKHTNWIRGLAISPDGQILASASDDQTVCLWNVETGALLHCLAGHRGGVLTVAFSRDGQILASGSDDYTIRLWTVATGELLKILHGHTSWVWSVIFAQNLMNPNERAPTSKHESDSDLAGQQLVSASDDQTIRLWDVGTGRILQTLRGHQDGVAAIALSPDQKRLVSCSYDHTVRTWDAPTGKCLNVLHGHREWVRSAVFLNERTIASASTDGTLKLWDFCSGKCLTTLIAERPYEGMNITGATGLTDAQKATLSALGAIIE